MYLWKDTKTVPMKKKWISDETTAAIREKEQQ